MDRLIKIGEHYVGEGKPCLIVAEAGINHDGDMKKAKMLIDAAVNCGADVIKFQTHLPEYEMLPLTPTASYVREPLFDLLTRVALSKKDHVVLKDYATKKGILFLSTPFSREAVDLLEEVGTEAYKVGSGEMTNLPLLEYIAGKGKPIILSTGMSTLDEIKESVDFLRRLAKDLVILYCVSSYPARYEDLNLKFINRLQKEFRLPIGFSDHSVGIYPALAVVALGACVVEKHFTIDRDWPGPDQKASITPPELAELVEGVRIIEKALGDAKGITAEELDIRKMARESVVSLVEIPKGTVVKENMVWVKRPGTGIPAKNLHGVLGKKARKRIEANIMIRWSDLE